jgi:ribosomal protein S18 acetylase RimI-like enzyme
MEPLDNPAWHALTGPHASFAEGTGLARRYDPQVAIFAALPDDPGEEAWRALDLLLGDRPIASLFQAKGIDVPPSWQVRMRIPGHQMVATRALGEDDRAFAPLSARDAPEMLDLVGRTRPGPFFERTVELGTYLGLREGGELVAMAGERMHLHGYTEISAVCTDERARRRGIATRLVRAVAAGIERRGETPMLHVATGNTNAIRLYESLGFEIRATFDFVVVEPPR